MKYIDFDESRELDLIPIGRVAIDFNPTDYYNTLDTAQGNIANFNAFLHGDTINGLFIDGHVQSLQKSAWPDQCVEPGSWR